MIWLIGCKGMLGSEVAKQLSENKLPFIGTDKEVDITNLNIKFTIKRLAIAGLLLYNNNAKNLV